MNFVGAREERLARQTWEDAWAGSGSTGQAVAEDSRLKDQAQNKVRENRLRRIAERRGYRLTKSRARDKAAPGYGGYMLIAAFGNLVMLGADPYSFSATLEEVEDYLNQADAAGDHPSAAHIRIPRPRS